VWHRPATERVPASAGFGSLQTCGSPWVCPVCSAKIAAERRNELARGVEAWRKLGGGGLPGDLHDGPSCADVA